MQWQLAYTGNNNACLRHKRCTDNDRDQQTYGSDRSEPEKIPEMTFNGHTKKKSQCKNDRCGSKNTHMVVPEKLSINFFWPKHTVLRNKSKHFLAV
jgi:hypothetical protein